MYRSPDTTPRCVACGNSNLTPETKFDTSEGYANLYFKRRDVVAGFFSTSDTQTLAIDRARACLDCGYVMLFLGEGKLEWLRKELPGLVPA